MRGDFVDVIYKTGPTVATQRVQARGVGGRIEVNEPRDREPFVTVVELGRNSDPIQTARFAKGEVVALIEGHETIKRAQK